MTRSGELLGTPRYMAPEQVSGGQVDHRVDLYAFGLILYEMVTGTVPFPRRLRHRGAAERVQSKPPDPRDRQRRYARTAGGRDPALPRNQPESSLSVCRGHPRRPRHRRRIAQQFATRDHPANAVDSIAVAGKSAAGAATPVVARRVSRRVLPS
jgi:serine/threonine protein kinase